MQKDIAVPPVLTLLALTQQWWMECHMLENGHRFGQVLPGNWDHIQFRHTQVQQLEPLLVS
jgi:hypothetical protein